MYRSSLLATLISPMKLCVRSGAQQFDPHPEERRQPRLEGWLQAGLSWFETAQMRLLTMRETRLISSRAFRHVPRP